MPEQTTQKIERKTNINFGFGISLSEWASSALIGVGSAIWAAIGTVFSRFDDDIRNSHSITESAAESARTLESTITEAKDLTAEKIWEKVVETKLGLAKEIDDYKFVRLKISKNFFEGLRGRMKTLTKHSKEAIVRNAIVGSIIGSAMALSFFNSVAIRDKLNKIDDAVEPAPPIAEAEGNPKDKHHAKAKHAEKPAAAEKTKPDHKVTDVTSEKKLVSEAGQSLAS